MSLKARLVLVTLVILSFAGSAGLLIVAVDFLHAPVAAAGTLARVASRLAAPRRLPTAFLAVNDGPETCMSASSTLMTRDGEREPFAVIDGDKDSHNTVTFGHDTPRLSHLLEGASEHIVWFERDGVEYVIRDPETVARAEHIVEPLAAVGHAMGEVGGRMGRIGAHQGQVGGELGRLGGRLGVLEAERARAIVNGGSGDDTRAEIADVREQMDRVRERMHDSGDQTDMSEMRERMRELRGRHREAMLKVREQMHGLIDDALRSGHAQRLGVGA